MKENTFFDSAAGMALDLDEIARLGAQQMIQLALQAEVSRYIERMEGYRLNDGRAAIVRNGTHRLRKVTIGSGSVEVAMPRTRNRSGEKENFISVIIPPYMRRSPKIDEVIPLLYLRGLSNGDIYPALKELLGESVKGLSPANVTRLKSGWQQEYEQWQKRDLSLKRYCYIWVDGIHFNVRFGDNRLCVLVVIGATEEGKKELIAVASGYRESAESWHQVLTDLKERGMQDPTLAIGDGALGFWRVIGEVFPHCKEQRCWVHKTVNILDKLPKHKHGDAKSMLRDIYMAESRKMSEKAWNRFVDKYKDKYPKATECLIKNQDQLLAFYDFPANHWEHIRSTNPIESPFATVRLRTDKTRGQGTEMTTHMMVFKLLEQASLRWHKLNASNLIPFVLAGKQFVDGVMKKAA